MEDSVSHALVCNVGCCSFCKAPIKGPVRTSDQNCTTCTKHPQRLLTLTLWLIIIIMPFLDRFCANLPGSLAQDWHSQRWWDQLCTAGWFQCPVPPTATRTHGKLELYWAGERNGPRRSEREQWRNRQMVMSGQWVYIIAPVIHIVPIWSQIKSHYLYTGPIQGVFPACLVTVFPGSDQDKVLTAEDEWIFALFAGFHYVY